MTTTLQEAIAEAQKVAVTRQHQEIDIAHLWKNFFLQPNHFGRNFFTQMLVLDVDAFEREVDNALDEYPSVAGGNVQYGQKFKSKICSIYCKKADSLREEFQDEFLSTEIVLFSFNEIEKNYRLTKIFNATRHYGKRVKKKILKR